MWYKLGGKMSRTYNSIISWQIIFVWHSQMVEFLHFYIFQLTWDSWFIFIQNLFVFISADFNDNDTSKESGM